MEIYELFNASAAAASQQAKPKPAESREKEEEKIVIGRRRPAPEEGKGKEKVKEGEEEEDDEARGGKKKNSEEEKIAKTGTMLSDMHSHFQYILRNKTEGRIVYSQAQTSDTKVLNMGDEISFSFSNPYQPKLLEVMLIGWTKTPGFPLDTPGVNVIPFFEGKALSWMKFSIFSFVGWTQL